MLGHICIARRARRHCKRAPCTSNRFAPHPAGHSCRRHCRSELGNQSATCAATTRTSQSPVARQRRDGPSYASRMRLRRYAARASTEARRSGALAGAPCQGGAGGAHRWRYLARATGGRSGPLTQPLRPCVQGVDRGAAPQVALGPTCRARPGSASEFHPVDRADRQPLRLRRPESSHPGLRQTRACGAGRMAAEPSFTMVAGLATNLAGQQWRGPGGAPIRLRRGDVILHRSRQAVLPARRSG